MLFTERFTLVFLAKVRPLSSFSGHFCLISPFVKICHGSVQENTIKETIKGQFVPPAVVYGGEMEGEKGEEGKYGARGEGKASRGGKMGGNNSV